MDVLTSQNKIQFSIQIAGHQQKFESSFFLFKRIQPT